jgi:hypothetical protein
MVRRSRPFCGTSCFFSAIVGDNVARTSTSKHIQMEYFDCGVNDVIMKNDTSTKFAALVDGMMEIDGTQLQMLVDSNDR